MKCNECGASTDSYGMQRHIEWHQNLNHRLVKLFDQMRELEQDLASRTVYKTSDMEFE